MGRKSKKQGRRTLEVKSRDAKNSWTCFNAEPERELNVTDIFQQFHATTHPAKMVVLDSLTDLTLDDYLSTDGNGNYRNAVRSNVMEGTICA